MINKTDNDQIHSWVIYNPMREKYANIFISSILWTDFYKCSYYREFSDILEGAVRACIDSSCLVHKSAIANGIQFSYAVPVICATKDEESFYICHDQSILISDLMVDE